MIIYVDKNGGIVVPENIRKLFSTYVTFIIKEENILLRMPTAKDNWNMPNHKCKEGFICY